MDPPLTIASSIVRVLDAGGIPLDRESKQPRRIFRVGPEQRHAVAARATFAGEAALAAHLITTWRSQVYQEGWASTRLLNRFLDHCFEPLLC